MPICNYKKFTSLSVHRTAILGPAAGMHQMHFLLRSVFTEKQITTASHLKGQMFNKKIISLKSIQGTVTN